MTRKYLQAVTAAAVAAAFGLSLDATVRADGANLEELQNRLIDLNQQAQTIQATAQAESRELTDEERTNLDEIFAAFEATNADVDRLERLETMNQRMATPGARRTDPDGGGSGDDDAAAGAENRAGGRPRNPNPNASRAQADAAGRGGARASLPAQARDPAERNRWGFRSFADFCSSVVASSARGGRMDPRLIANAPTSTSSEGVGADGGFAVPPEWRSAIMAKVAGEDSMLPMTDEQITSTNSLTLPADETTPWQSSGGVQAYWEGEGQQLTQSKIQLTEKMIKTSKVTALIPVTSELLDDAPAMANYVNRKAPEKIAFKVNDAIMNGTGVGMPLGILNSAGTVVVPAEGSQTADTVNFANLQKLWAAVTPSARRGAAWFMNADVETQLQGLSFPGTGTAVPVYLPPGGLSAAPYGTLFGKPIYYTEAMQALGDQGDIVFGDLKNYLSVVKAGGVRADTSIHVWFDYDITAFRFILRVGGQPWWNSKITPNRAGSTSRGFFATLAVRP